MPSLDGCHPLLTYLYISSRSSPDCILFSCPIFLNSSAPSIEGLDNSWSSSILIVDLLSCPYLCSFWILARTCLVSAIILSIVGFLVDGSSSSILGSTSQIIDRCMQQSWQWVLVGKAQNLSRLVALWYGRALAFGITAKGKSISRW